MARKEAVLRSTLTVKTCMTAPPCDWRRCRSWGVSCSSGRGGGGQELSSQRHGPHVFAQEVRCRKPRPACCAGCSGPWMPWSGCQQRKGACPLYKESRHNHRYQDAVSSARMLCMLSELG
ncbi:hypothetical protein L1887_55520 [Cichorium endivia]|nr:hypothetical protein L1887_55520 [Cichorium endivia]